MSDEPAKAIANRLVCGGLLDPSQRSVDANTSIISDKLASLTTELDASRAREAKMREALEKIELELREYYELWVTDGTDAADCITVSRALRNYARAALSASEDAK